MKTVISVTNSNQWPEHNQAEFLFRKFVENEYQFEMSAGGRKVLVTFHKGNWECLFPGNHRITVGDNFDVWGNDDPMSVAFLQMKVTSYFEKAGENDNHWRSVPAQALWDYARLLCGNFESESTITFVIELPGRNGSLSEAGTIVTNRKDW